MSSLMSASWRTVQEDPGEVLLEGFHAVKHALRFAPQLVQQVRLRDPGQARDLATALAPDVLDELLRRGVPAPVSHHTGVEASAVRPPERRDVLHARSGILVVLEQPRDPGNAGAVVRVAAAAGAAGVAMTGDLDPWHPSVLRGSAGLHFALPVLHLASLDGLTGPVAVLDAVGDPVARLPQDATLVVGSERSGLSTAALQRADLTVALPMRPGVSSLNLATAVAAMLYRGR